MTKANFRSFDDEDLLSALAEAKGVGADILIGHSIELYCEQGWTLEIRQSMVKLASDYQRSLGDRITHYHPRESARLKRIAGVDWVDYFLRLAETVKVDDEEGFDTTLYGFDGGQDIDAATPYFFCAIASPQRKRYSRINAYYPADWFQTSDGTDRYIRLMQQWCSLLKVSHGTAGFSLILEEGQPKDGDVRAAFPLLKRFPGLDLPYSSRWSSSVRRTDRRYIRTINWLTAIDDDFVEELGGWVTSAPRWEMIFRFTATTAVSSCRPGPTRKRAIEIAVISPARTKRSLSYLIRSSSRISAPNCLTSMRRIPWKAWTRQNDGSNVSSLLIETRFSRTGAVEILGREKRFLRCFYAFSFGFAHVGSRSDQTARS